MPLVYLPDYCLRALALAKFGWSDTETAIEIEITQATMYYLIE
jgi:hypothetical protein